MLKKLLPMALVAVAFLVACDDEDSASVKPAQESLKLNAPPKPYTEEFNRNFTCDSERSKTSVTSVNFGSVYRLSEEKGTLKVVINFEAGFEKDKVTEFCEEFAKKFNFGEYECAEGLEAKGLHSTIEKETSKLEENFDGYVDFLCGDAEE